MPFGVFLGAVALISHRVAGPISEAVVSCLADAKSLLTLLAIDSRMLGESCRLVLSQRFAVLCSALQSLVLVQACTLY